MAHGGDRYRNSVELDFSVNLNPLGIPEQVKNRIVNCMDQLSFYPDSEVQMLGKKLSECLNRNYCCELQTGADGLTPQNIVFGNGASELITAVVNAVKPKKILLPVPSFKGYERAIRNCGAEITEAPLNDRMDLDDSVPEMISDDYDLLFLTNPNNPTGRYIGHGLLMRVLDACRKHRVIVVLDECFMELSDDPSFNTCLGKLSKWPNLLILRAFTKTFAIPGIRLGYLAGRDEKLLDRIRWQLPEWNISCIAQEAGIAALDVLEEDNYLEDARRMIIAQREFMKQSLQNMGFEVIDSNTCFLMIRYRKTDVNLYEQLLERRVLIRDCSDYRHLERGFYRIAVKTPEENIRLLELLKELT